MNYAFMTFSTPELTLAENLALARRVGYQGIEPRIGCGHRHGIELEAGTAARREACERVGESGIALACLATSCTYANPETQPQQVELTRQAIELAGEVGAARLRVFGGGIPAGVSRATAVGLLVEALSAVATQAAGCGVIVCLETHDDWCNPADVAEVLRQVNHPAIAVNWDIMHPVRTGFATIEQSYALLKPWIAHLHVHDGALAEPLTLLPIGEGAIDHRRAIELLLDHDYTGFISGEWIDWEPYETHLPRELATLQRYEREAAGSRSRV